MSVLILKETQMHQVHLVGNILQLRQHQQLQHKVREILEMLPELLMEHLDLVMA
jgi:hypothetical protein